MNQLIAVNLRNERLPHPINLTIEPSECVCISGPSGSGKTTLLRALCDLDPHEGEVFLNGIECKKFTGPQWRKHIGLLSGESQWWHESVGEHFRAVDDGQLKKLGLKRDMMNWPINRPSTGERQRLALLRLLANHPQVLLLDEPTANLDPISTQQVEKIISDYRTLYKVSVIWISHDLRQIKRVCKRRYHLEKGRLTVC